MQAGARDFLPGPLLGADLVASIERAVGADREGCRRAFPSLIAIVNAKGGSGATFVASNVAYLLDSMSRHSTVLVSLDMQFESLAQYFDVSLKHGLMEVLENVADLDTVALDAYMTRHDSGLRLLAAQPENSFEDQIDRSAELGILLDKMTNHFASVVVDMPRRVSAYTRPVLERVTRVVLVAQQTLSHLRDATRMLQVFKHHGVAQEQVLVVVNRLEKNSPISMDDMERALHGVEVVGIPSDFKTVAESINLGVPIYEHARGSSVTKALLNLETKLGGRPAKASGGGLFGKAFANLMRKE